MPLITTNTYVSPNIIVTDTVANLRLVDMQLCDNAVAFLHDNTAGGTAALYKYESSSSSADNGSTIIKPDSVSASAAGRWLRGGGAL